MKEKVKAKNRSGWILLGITVVLYGYAAFLDTAIALNAMNKSLDVLKMIAPILLIVFFLMAVLNTFIKPKSIAKYLGEKSGYKGWTLALVSGVLSHGSTLVWYPMLSELRKHGARDGLIVAFFYARAIKLPWIPVMIGYFGLGFTLVLSFYILLGALLQGLLMERMKA
ncbi:MAG: permease [Campylobacterota bacterium]|nr:permease [Campylobacterota bacterium]